MSTKSRRSVKHKFKVGDIIGYRVYPKLTFYGKIKKLIRTGAAEEPAYIISGFGDPVNQSIKMFKARKTKI